MDPIGIKKRITKHNTDLSRYRTRLPAGLFLQHVTLRDPMRVLQDQILTRRDKYIK